MVLTWPRLLGLSVEEVAHAADLPLARLEADVALGYEETLRLWAGIDRLTEDPIWGVRAGARFTLDQMGVVGPALAHASHLDAAIDVLVRVMNLFVQNANIRRVEIEHAAGIEYRAPTLRSRHGIDTIFAAATALVRHCTGVRIVPHAIEHQMPRAEEDGYRTFFGVVPRWNQPASQLLFARADLRKPFLGASPGLSNLLLEHAPKLLVNEPTSTFDQEFERAFWVAHEGATGATLETVAAEMGLSGRTLQRKLASMDTSFGALRSGVLARRAELLLHDRTLHVEAIAQRLGFSSRGAFERAFLRWTGRRPRAT